MDTRKSVAVLFGGRSVEHEISIITATQLMSAFDVVRYHLVPVYLDPDGGWWTGDDLLEKGNYPVNKNRLTRVSLLPEPGIGGLLIRSSGDILPIDIVLLAFHGQYGEDGAMQGLLELADLPYTGSPLLPTAIAMHKAHCKAILKQIGIPTLPWCSVRKEETQKNRSEVEQRLTDFHPLPLCIKPVNLGSSIAIGKATDALSLTSSLAHVFKYDDEAIVEPFLESMVEINISVMDGEASPVEIPVASDEILSYEDKYLRGSKNKGSSALGDGMASLVRSIDPEDLPSEIKEEVTTHALAAYHHLRCRGVVRFDFMLDTQTDQLYFNELNPIPGSLSYYLWEKSEPRLLYTELLNRLIEEAETRHATRRSLVRTPTFRAIQQV